MGRCTLRPILLSGVTACSHGRHLSEAMKLCQIALRGQRIVSAQLTTVAEVRHFKGGPNLTFAPSACPEASDLASAAWCWTSQGGGNWTAYAAGPNGMAVRLGAMDGVSQTPTGQPAFPDPPPENSPEYAAVRMRRCRRQRLH
jgi:hypothetical protein